MPDITASFSLAAPAFSVAPALSRQLLPVALPSSNARFWRGGLT